MKLFILLLLVACAKPNYISTPTAKIESVTSEQGCLLHFAMEDLCLSTEWLQKPSESDFGSMELTFRDRTNPERLVSPRHEPHVELWMTTMGHGSSPVRIEKIEEGTYLVRDIFFIMPGPWDIRYQLKDGVTVLEQAIQQISI